MSRSRLQTITKKINRKTTGLAGSLFVHIDFSDDGVIDAVSFSEKGKDDSTLDNILDALGNATTEIIMEIIYGKSNNPHNCDGRGNP